MKFKNRWRAFSLLFRTALHPIEKIILIQQLFKEGYIPPVENEVSPSTTSSNILHLPVKESVICRIGSCC